MILGLGRSPGKEKGCPIQYSGLENSLDCYRVGQTERLSLSHFHSVVMLRCDLRVVAVKLRAQFKGYSKNPRGRQEEMPLTWIQVVTTEMTDSDLITVLGTDCYSSHRYFSL